MKNKESLKKITIYLLSIFYLGLGFTSVFHGIDFWAIFNQPFYSYVLATMVLFGMVAVLLLTFLEIGKTSVKASIFILVLFAELCGNVFYHYLHTDVNSELYVAFLDLNTVLFNHFDMIDELTFSEKLKSINSLFFGLWMSILQIAVFNALITIISHKEDIVQEEEDIVQEVNYDEDVEVEKNLSRKEVSDNKNIELEENIDPTDKISLQSRTEDEKSNVIEKQKDISKKKL